MGIKVSELYGRQPRTMVEIREQARWKRVQHDSIKDDLQQIETLADLDRYVRKEITPELQRNMGNAWFLVEEYIETRRIEIQQENPDGHQSIRDVRFRV